MLRSEIFVSEDRQLQAIHLILDFELLSNLFQDVGQAIRANDPRLARIDVSMLGFLAQEDLPPIELPFHCFPREVAALKEETASLHLSLEAKIDKFRLEEEGESQERPMNLSDFEGELDRSSVAHSPKLIIAQVDNSFEEEENMALNPRKGLKDILARRNKGSSSKEAPKTQLPHNPPLPPLPSPLSLLPNPDLQKKKSKEKDIEEGEITRNNRKSPMIKRGSPRWRVGRPSTRPMYAIQLGTPSWNWIAWHCPGTPQSRNSR